MRYPFEGIYPITQDFGEKITSNFHTGIDFGCPEGTELFAVCDGIIQQFGYEPKGYGHYVIIRPTGESSGILYGHLSSICVEQNQEVATGDLIGLSGNTGNSTGPHLHFECRSQWDKPDTYYKPKFDEIVSDFVPQEITGDTATVIAPSGANLRGDNLELLGFVTKGTIVKFTGNKRSDNGIPRREIVLTGWLAEHDGENQILS